MIRIIGLLGRARSGKDTVAGMLAEAVPEARIRRLAAPLKEAVSALYGFSAEDLEGDSKDTVDLRYGVTPRDAIRHLCAAMMAYHGTDFFTRRFYETHGGAGTVVGARGTLIIPDIRWAHDIQEIRRRGGVVIRVVRDLEAAGYKRHGFEDMIDGFSADFVIENDGSLEDLRAKVARLLADLDLKN